MTNFGLTPQPPAPPSPINALTDAGFPRIAARLRDELDWVTGSNWHGSHAGWR